MSKAASWELVIDRFYRCLSSWKSKALSIGGRLTLTKSVLSSLPIYYLSLFRAPLNTADLLEKIRRRFFWGFKDDERGMSWFNWKTVMCPFNKGGLGIGSIRAKNLALLGKWWWRFHVEKDALWNKAIGEIYGPVGGLSTSNGLGIKKGVWDNIISIGYYMDHMGTSSSSSFRRLVGNGESIFFWHDRWLDDGLCLKILFPRLYALEENKFCLLNERLT